MPPFVSTECPNCQHHKRFDLAELRKNDGVAYKGTVYRAAESAEEFFVTCEKCGREFKFPVPRRRGDGKEI